MTKTTILLFATFFVFGKVSFAQQKYGHINSEEVVRAMPEFKQLSESVEKRKKDAQTKVQAMYDSFQQKKKELDQYGPSMMQAIREERMKELDSLQKSLSTYQQTATEELQQFEQKLLKPLNDKYLKILGAVAKENGYSYIFDLSSQAVVYHPESTGDVTDLVKKKLGIN